MPSVLHSHIQSDRYPQIGTIIIRAASDYNFPLRLCPPHRTLCWMTQLSGWIRFTIHRQNGALNYVRHMWLSGRFARIRYHKLVWQSGFFQCIISIKANCVTDFYCQIRWWRKTFFFIASNSLNRNTFLFSILGLFIIQLIWLLLTVYTLNLKHTTMHMCCAKCLKLNN